MVWKGLVWCDHCVRWNMTLCRSESHAKTRVASVSNQGAMLGFEIDFCHFSFDKTNCSSYQLYAWYLQHVLTTGVSRCNLISFDCGTLISLYQLLQSRNALYNGATPIVLMYNGCILGPIDNHVVQQGTNCMETHQCVKKSLGQPCLARCNHGICAENVQFKIKKKHHRWCNENPWVCNPKLSLIDGHVGFQSLWKYIYIKIFHVHSSKPLESLTANLCWNFHISDFISFWPTLCSLYCVVDQLIPRNSRPERSTLHSVDSPRFRSSRQML